ncbi:DUF4142 domain-containing protein [Ramlibacter tataouinensis]|uniref:DUF4142 domain-containing protein n=1 Tax=Ramlibacter tataouinensis TaxID=94132 RepID=UPI0022F3851B|nr:DUF4142 domain-containing protein [Ramlibacter tataouinensis]WBY00978.1 DUF4142 domain-containing protein [Ramlibacter tataouinensis]
MNRHPIDFHRRLVAAALAAGPLLAGCASTGRRSQLAADDEVLALRAAGLGLYELSVAQLVQARADRADLQAFGRLLAEHHGPANAELLGLLQARGAVPPRAMPAYLELRLARLQLQMQAQDGFDRRFVQVAGLQDQERLLALHEYAALAVQDGALHGWFASQLPALRSHLAVARSLAAPRA